MRRFFNPNALAVPPQDIEMANNNVVDQSTHTTSSSVHIAPRHEIELDSKNAPEIFAFIENQKKTIENCMAQVSHHILMNIEVTIYKKIDSA
jgi:hypothetical protein